MILCVIKCYNEIEYLPLQIAWLEHNGVVPYVLDNCSNDGTWKWLCDNKIQSEQIDTNGQFHLSRIQKRERQIVSRLKPEWAMHLDAEMFWVCDDLICNKISAFNKKIDIFASYAVIEFIKTVEGEPNLADPIAKYFWGWDVPSEARGPFRRCYKPKDGFVFGGDDVSGRNLVKAAAPDAWTRTMADPSIAVNGVLLNYGKTKSIQKRDEAMERRKKAVKNGGYPGALGGFEWLSKKGWKRSINEPRMYNVKDCPEDGKYYKIFAEFAAAFYEKKIR